MVEGPSRTQSHSQQQGVHCQLLLMYAGACEWRCGPKTASPSGAPESQARQGRARSARWSGRSRSPVWNSLKKESAGRRSSLQPGLLRSPCRPRWVRLKSKRKRCRLQVNPPAAGAAIDGGDGGRNTGGETPRRSKKVVNPHTWPVCAKIAKLGGGEREPTQVNTFSTSPPKADTRDRRGGSAEPQALMR